MLVGGQGTRLRPLTINTPKPMLPVAGVPFTMHQILRARDAGVDRIVLGTSYRADVFREFMERTDVGIEVVIATEDEPLGTGGAIRFAAEHLASDPDEPVLVFNGDVLTGLDIAALVAEHRARASDVSLYLTPVEDPRAFGLVPTDADGRVTAFLEKPTTEAEIVTNTINAGCYVFRRSVIDEIPPGRVVSVERETFPTLLAEHRQLFGFVDEGYWLDLGTPLAFVQGSRDLVLGRAPSPAVTQPGHALVLEGATIADDAHVVNGTAVGRNAQIASGAHVSGSVIFDGAVIEAGAQISDSIIGAGARIGAECIVDGAVIGDGAIIGPHNELRTGARVWPEVQIGACAIRYSSDT